MVRAIGFAPRECFDRHILFVDDDSINTAITISANSLQRIMRHAMPYLNNKSSTITSNLCSINTFCSELWAMSIAKAALESWTRELACQLGPDGHRLNAISSGLLRQLPLEESQVLIKILDHVEENSPLRRNVNQTMLQAVRYGWSNYLQGYRTMFMSMRVILLQWCQDL